MSGTVQDSLKAYVAFGKPDAGCGGMWLICVYDAAGNVIGRNVWQKRRQAVKPIRRKRESQIRVPETRSTFHPYAQRNAFRRRDVRLQSR
jgi:hypothetical protein